MSYRSYREEFLVTIADLSKCARGKYERETKRYDELRDGGKTHSEAIYELTHKKGKELGTASEIKGRMNNYLNFIQLQESQIMMDFEDKATDTQEPTQATDNTADTEAVSVEATDTDTDTVNAGGFEQAVALDVKTTRVGRKRKDASGKISDKKIMVYVTDDLYSEFTAIAEIENISVSQIVTSLIRQYISSAKTDNDILALLELKQKEKELQKELQLKRQNKF